MDKKVMYEFEANRTNISPKQFYTYCRKRMLEKTGHSITEWLDHYDNWANPIMPSNEVDWTSPCKEICKTMPYEWHLFLAGSYNFIMEWADGRGYMYVIEFER